LREVEEVEVVEEVEEEYKFFNSFNLTSRVHLNKTFTSTPSTI